MQSIYDFSEDINMELLKNCSKMIKDGYTVVFPTETVYGIGTNALDKKAVKKIFRAKQRPLSKPLIVLISDYKMLRGIVKGVNKTEKKLMNKFWPGPLTIILHRTELIPDIVTGGSDTVGIRMTSSKIARNLIKYAKVPVVAPSANVSGRPSGTDISDIIEELDDKVDIMINNGPCEDSVESTIVEVINDTAVILRLGKISREDIEKMGIKTTLDDKILKMAEKCDKTLSYEAQYGPYVPNTKTILVETRNKEKFIKYVNSMLDDNLKVCVIGFEEYIGDFENTDVEFLSLGKDRDFDNISKNLFSALRKVDNLGVDVCYISSVEKKDIGTAIMNRLYRACGYNIIKI